MLRIVRSIGPYVAQNGMNMDQWEWTSFLVRSALKKNTNLLDQVVHRSSPVIQLIKSWTEQSILVEIDPYIAKFGPYFIHYLRQSIILLNVMVDHFDTGPEPCHLLISLQANICTVKRSLEGWVWALKFPIDFFLQKCG